jgi:cytochrome-b5 reductase
LLLAGILGAIGAGGYYYFTTSQSIPVDPAKNTKKIPSQGASKSNPTFLGGDQGWIGLRLESIETINHNTKRFRFSLPEKDDVSGLHVACTLSRSPLRK